MVITLEEAVAVLAVVAEGPVVAAAAQAAAAAAAVVVAVVVRASAIRRSNFSEIYVCYILPSHKVCIMIISDACIYAELHFTCL